MMNNISEEVVRRNIESMKQFVEEDRKLVRELQEEVNTLSKQVATQSGLIDEFNKQIAILHSLRNGTGPTA